MMFQFSPPPRSAHRGRRPVLILLLVVLLSGGAGPAPLVIAAPVSLADQSGPARFQDDDDDDDDGGGGDDDFGDDNGGNDDFDDDDLDDDDDVYVPPADVPITGDDDDDFDDDGDDFADDEFDDDGGGNDPVFTAPIVGDDPATGDDGYRAQQAVVQLVPGADIGAFMARHGAFLAAAIPDQQLYLIGLPGTPEDPVVLEPLIADDDTVWAELNYAHQAPEGRPGRFFLSAEAVAPEQVAAAPAPAMLAIPAAQACATGAGAVVAVLDTGVDATHPALASRMVGGGWNVLINSGDTRDAGNGVDDDRDGLIDEMSGHGTHVAGIIAQAAPAAGIMPVKVLDSDGVGDAFYVAAGIYQAIGAGADVINLSLGSTRDSRVIRDAVGAANDAGIVVVAAAGNANQETPEYPALDPAALGVAATDATDRKSAFSNYNADLFLSAPGDDIVSAFPGGGYVAWSGTSMATPWVAGAAALVIGAGAPASPAAVAAALADSAAPLPAQDAVYEGKLGAGRLDVGAAACSGA